MSRDIASHLPQPPLEMGHALPERPSGEYRHWHFHESDADMVWLVLDRAEARANTLDEAVLGELERAVVEIERIRPRALVIRSAKASGFAAGADLRMLEGMRDEAAARSAIESAQAILTRIEALDLPTIAIVHGHCLGGGLELALACRYRLASPDATFGFPEVRLGLHPGLGGTVRLTRQIDSVEALKLMLTGRAIDARRARRLGLVDAVCEERHFAKAVRMAAQNQLPRCSGGRAKQVILSLSPSRAWVARRLESESARRANREHYPAPFALIDLWRQHGDDRRAMLEAERESFVRLLGTPTARNLIRVFFLREHLKSLGEGGEPPIRHVHVIGAGAMGGDIAAWCALQGCTVTLEDLSRPTLAAACARAARLFEEKARGPERQRALDRFIPDFKAAGLGRADLVIEAVPERLEVKQSVYRRVEPLMKRGALLATNTSSLPLEQLCVGLARPERFLGLHFFNPVAKMQLVEIVAHERSDPAALDGARAFVAGLDRLPAPVRSAPGFLVNRALLPYLLEALVLLDEGVPADDIDAAALQFGMPMGPIELADQVGLDVCVQVADVLQREVPEWLRQKVKQGELGAKSGGGLRAHARAERAQGGERAVSSAAPAPLAERLILPLINACVACLREGVVENERAVDAAMVFGAGFAPFRGGPLHYARERGIDVVVQRLEALAREHGPRFAPDPGWERMR